MNLKVILDTSFLISSLISSRTNAEHQILQLVKQKDFDLYYSKETFDEFQTTLQSQNVKKYLKGNLKKIAQFVPWYKYTALKTQPNQKVSLCRDPKDDKFLELALEIDADYLITQDNDLLVLQNFGNTKIVDPEEFLRLWKNKKTER